MKSMLKISAMLCVLAAPRALAQDVKFDKYQLPNGLTVILHEDHTLPVACVNLWYRVGSKDEPERRSGFAHLFEHLMFMGTDRVPGGEFDNIMEAGGGWNNATTSEDRTNYFDMGPAELLPTLLWLEADRLEQLGQAMNQEKLDKQRDVVRNERRQSYENAPYGKAELRIYGLMFPEGHPYHIPVIGTHEDLQAATVNDVKNFFATYYVPSNASLAVAGDFDPADVKPLIDKLFGTLRRGSDVEHAKAQPVKLDGVRRFTETDNVQFARTSIVYHSPAFYAPGDAEMDLAGAVLSSGISSRLYQKLVYEKPLAVSVNAYQASMGLGSLFYIEATAKPGVTLDEIEETIDETLDQFLREGPSEEELSRQKAQIEYRMVSRLQSVLAKADKLNEYEYYFGDPGSFKRDLDRYRDATTMSVRDWARKVLTPDARLILRVVPDLETADQSGRDQKPALASAKSFDPPEPKTFTLSNGIKVYHWERSELPLAAVTLLLPVGSTADPQGEAGLAALTVDMLDEGAGSRSATEFADALDLLGATLNTDVNLESTQVRMSVLSSNFDSALDLFADAVLRPRFDEKEWQRVHDLHVQNLIRAEDQPQIVAARVGMHAFFGDGHPFGRPTPGTPESARVLTLSQAKGFAGRIIGPNNAVFLVAGDIPAEQIQYQLEKRFGSWRANGTPVAGPSKFPEPANKGFRVVIVDRPDAVQTVIRFVMPGPKYDTPLRPRLELFNTILGGSFTSRLNQNLREEHGYTYGARSGYAMNPSAGYFVASSAVRADVTGASIREFLSEFKDIRSADISAGETEKAVHSERTDVVQSFQGLNGLLSTAATLIRNGRPFSELGQELRAVAGTSASDLNALAHDAVPLEKSVLVLVGDKNAITAQLEGLDLPTPEEVSVEGDPVVR